MHFCDSLSLYIVLSRFSWVVICIRTSFLWPNNIPLHQNLLFHPLLDIWVLWIMLLWTFACKFLYDFLSFPIMSFSIPGSHVIFHHRLLRLPRLCFWWPCRSMCQLSCHQFTTHMHATQQLIDHIFFSGHFHFPKFYLQ